MLEFKEWILLIEGQWFSAETISSLNGTGSEKAFFIFDDNPVVSIDFKFELMPPMPSQVKTNAHGFNQLNSIAGSRWYCKIPGYVKYADGQIVYCETLPSAAGPYIVINRYIQAPLYPYVSLSRSPMKAIKEQMNIEIHQKANKLDPSKPDEKINFIQKEFQKLEENKYDGLYTALPSNWLTYATIEVKRVDSQKKKITCRRCSGGRIDNDTLDGARCDVCGGTGWVNNPNIIPFQEFETIALYEKTHVRTGIAAIA